MSHDLTVGLTSAALVCAAACVAPSKPRRTPDATLTVRHFAGTPFAGMLPGAPKVRAENALVTSCTLYWRHGFPLRRFAALATVAAEVAETAQGRPLVATTDLVRSARAGAGPEASSFAASVASSTPALARRVGALPLGVTAAFAIRSPTDPQTRFEVQIARPAAKDAPLHVVLESRGRITVPVDPDEITEARDAGKPPPKPDSVARRELIALTLAPMIDGPPLVLTFPQPFAESPPLVLVLRVQSPTGSALEATTVARCLREVQTAQARAATKRTLLDAGQLQSRERQAAWLALRDPERTRSALVFLASESDASLTGDVALAADTPLLTRLAAAYTRTSSKFPGDDLGWFLERHTITLLAKALEDGKLAPAIVAILLRRTGAPGRSASTLTEASGACRNLGEFDERLVAENLLALEDSDPSARIRAYDWLAVRTRAPRDFDPLGPRKARRSALRAAEARRAPATQGSPK